MSLILDALKKSEAERQRGQVPNLLSPSPISRADVIKRKNFRWPWLLLAIALPGLAIGCYFYVRTKETPSDTIATVVLKPPIVQTVPARVADVVSSKPPNMLPNTAAPIQQNASPMGTTPMPPAEQTSAIVEVLPAAPQIASLAEMSSEQRQQLPALKLSMHVYSAEPDKRFAIIDGQRINEGSMLGNAIVVQIRQDGVVLSVQGQLYLLPRP